MRPNPKLSRLPEGSNLAKLPPSELDRTMLREAIATLEQGIPESCNECCREAEVPCDIYIARNKRLNLLRSLRKILNWIDVPVRSVALDETELTNLWSSK